MKINKLSLKIILGTFGSIWICAIFYLLIAPFAINYTHQERIDFWEKVILIYIILSPIATYIVYSMFKPVSKIIQKDEITDEDKRIANKIIKNMTIFILIIGICAYLFGGIFNIARDYFSGKFKLDNSISRLLISVSWGLLNAVVTARFLNIILIEAKLKLKIFTLEEKKQEKYETIKFKIMFPAILLLIYFTVISGIMLYSSSKTLKNLIINNTQILVEQNNIENNIKIITNHFHKIFINSLFILLFLLTISIILFYVICIELQHHFDIILSQIKNFSSGVMNLSKRINIISYDDIGLLTSSINLILENLYNTFKSIKDAYVTLAESSNNSRLNLLESQNKGNEVNKILTEFENELNNQTETIKNTITIFNQLINKLNNLISNSQEQSSFIENTNKRLKNMLESFNDMNNNARKTSDIFKNLSESVSKGSEEIIKSANAIKEMNEASMKVENIINIISEIADSTNILSMNAAIEAAHAGEYGKGFSIVANEIRKLAENTLKSVDEINQLINEIKVKNNQGLITSNNLNKLFTELKQNMSETTIIINSIVNQIIEQYKEAQYNIQELNKLLNLTTQIKKENEELKQDNIKIQNSIEILYNTSEKFNEINKNMTANIKIILDTINKMAETLEITFASISNLEMKISSYKTED